jgi:PKD repeat protein
MLNLSIPPRAVSAWAFVMFLPLGTNTYAGQAALAWDASTGTQVGGYKLSYGQSTGNYATTVDVGNNTSYTVSNLQDGATYYFAVKAYDSARTMESPYSNEVSKTLPAANGLTASFTASPASGGAPLSVSFTPTITGTVTSWKWDYGDGSPVNAGSTATVPTAIKSYGTAGKYTATLTVTGPAGTVTKTAAVQVTPVASFNASTTSGNAPLAISFTDTSTGNPTGWTWSFGDNTTGTAQNPTHTYSAAGTYTVSLKATGGGLGSANTATKTITVGAGGSTGGGTTGGGLVAAYGFEENSGTIVADASGQKNHGALSGATWTAGKFGRALRFKGSSNQVTVKDSASLDLSAGLTLEAWVNPATTTGGGRTVILKEQTGGAVYNLYSSEDANLPLASIYSGNYRVVSGPSPLPLNQWSHLATTYDGQYQRLYVNGIEAAKRAQSGTIKTSAGALKIGGNSIWGEWFSGVIDEVRIYNKALAASEIQGDMNKSVASANPPQLMLGQNAIGTVLAPLTMGTAQAFQATASATGLATRVSVYIDAGSQASTLIAGIYADKQGHPGALLGKGSRSTTVPGSWNVVSLPAIALNSGTKYWVAVLSPNASTNPVVSLRTSSGSGLVETSAGASLTTLPSTWTTGTSGAGGQCSAYGAGY